MNTLSTSSTAASSPAQAKKRRKKKIDVGAVARLTHMEKLTEYAKQLKAAFL